MMNIATIGDNLPPEDDFTRVERQIGEFYDEAKVWLDGDPIDTPEIAEGIVTLMRSLQDCGKEAKSMHKEEKEPHLTAGRAVDDKYRPLTASVESAVTSCKALLGPWEAKQRAEQKAKADALQAEADEKLRIATETIRATNVADMAAREDAEGQLNIAKAYVDQAKREAKKTGGTKVAGSRAIGLRSVPVPEITSAMDAIIHYYSKVPDSFNEAILSLARQDIAANVRDIPGIKIVNKETVV